MPSNIIMADQKGGEDLLAKRITNTLESYTIPESVDSIVDGAFARCISLKTVVFPQTITLNGVGTGVGTFAGSGLTAVHLHTAYIKGYSAFRGCASLKTFVGEKVIVTTSNPNPYYLMFQCSNLEIFDADINSLQGEALGSCTKLKTIILRKSDGLTNGGAVSTFNQTPFKSGGSGGTIYIPKVIYDHLGDGTGLDYKAANVWSTIDGYGTITWAKIEGSIYETQYADGTPIPAGG